MEEIIIRESKEEIISVMKRKVLETWNEEWKFNTDYTGKGLFLRSIREDIEISNPIVQLHNRRHEVAIYRLRIGHAGLNDHCYRFNMCISRNCAFCHTPETIDHYFFDCVLYTMQREHLLRMLSQIGVVDPSLGTILGGEHRGKERQSIYKIVVSTILTIVSIVSTIVSTVSTFVSTVSNLRFYSFNLRFYSFNLRFYSFQPLFL